MSSTPDSRAVHQIRFQMHRIRALPDHLGPLLDMCNLLPQTRKPLSCEEASFFRTGCRQGIVQVLRVAALPNPLGKIKCGIFWRRNAKEL